MKRAGYWLSEKKRKKLNFDDFREQWSLTGLELVQIDLSQPLEDQGPLDVILHKLTDVVTKADEGDNRSQRMVSNLEDYIRNHPNVIVIDPLQSVRKLLKRHISYKLIQDCSVAFKDAYPAVGTPNFVKIETTDKIEIMRLMNTAEVEFPIVCKALQGHGSFLSHMMSIIFNEDGLKDVKPPCVAQTFVNHNARLHKLYIIGDHHYTVERPSLKNFTAGDKNTIFFDSHSVSKANSSSFLNELDESDLDTLEDLPPCPDTLSALVHSVRSELGMDLFGIDVIVEKDTRRHTVIDINAFPGYDGVPMFFDILLAHIHNLLGNQKQCQEIMERVAQATQIVKSCPLAFQRNGSSCNHTESLRPKETPWNTCPVKKSPPDDPTHNCGNEFDEIDVGCTLTTNNSICHCHLNSDRTESNNADTNHIAAPPVENFSNCPV